MAASLFSVKSMADAIASLAAAIEVAKTIVSLPGKAFFWRPFLVASSLAATADDAEATDDASPPSSMCEATGSAIVVIADW